MRKAVPGQTAMGASQLSAILLSTFDRHSAALERNSDRGFKISSEVLLFGDPLA